MKAKISGIARYMLGALCVSIILIFILFAARPASAQSWSVQDVRVAYSDFNLYFYKYIGGYYYYVTVVDGTNKGGFWQSAEKIEMAEDAYHWAEVNYTADEAADKTEITNLTNGFLQLHPVATWAKDTWNDDINVATIAFARCYQITGSSTCLSAAESGYSTVWSRARQGNGGLCEQTPGCYENSSVNWTFVIAARILYDITGTTTYKTDGDSVYTWAQANLYNSTTGEIYDAPGSGTNTIWDYNFGYALAAAFYKQDKSSFSSNVLNYLMYNLDNPNYPYDGTYNGYNILPNYGQGSGGTDNNDGGFNGITMRGVEDANYNGQVNSTQLAWAQANVGRAWAIRNSSGLSWDDWNHATPTNQDGVSPYSWDCSSTVAGMFNIPHP